MATRITVNGVTYDSVEAMPAETRRLYEQALARLPKLADRDGNGVPDIVEGKGGPLSIGTTVSRRFVLNGKTYDDPNAMPPDVRQLYEQAMKAVAAGGANVSRNDIKMSFEMNPTFRIGRPSRDESATNAPSIAAQPPAMMTPGPIEPASGEGGLRFGLIVGGCAAIGLVLWLISRAR